MACELSTSPIPSAVLPLARNIQLQITVHKNFCLIFIVKTSPEPMVVIDPEGLVMSLNSPASYKIHKKLWVL